MSDKNTKTAEMYAGCISGAIQKKEYLNLIRAIGFENITVQKEKTITVPDDILANYLSPDEIKEYKESGVGILSVTVVLFFYG